MRAGTGAILVGPDNGLLSTAWVALGGAEAVAAIEDPRVMLFPVSKTFHGRDVFAPAAAHLAVGGSLADVGPALEPGALRTLEMPGPMVTPVSSMILGTEATRGRWAAGSSAWTASATCSSMPARAT